MKTYGTPKAIRIFSASALDKYKGYVFVEAMQEKHVSKAIAGMSDVYESND